MTKKSGLRNGHDHHVHEFSRRAHSYIRHNIIQQKVAESLIASIDTKPKQILDLGCGAGAIYNLIDWDFTRFVGIDKADQMCSLHPVSPKVTLIHDDFEKESLLKDLGHFEIVISSSALQWASDIEHLLQNIAAITDEIAFAIFCDGTFHTIYEMTGIDSFLPDSNYLEKILQRYFDADCHTRNYRLEFPDNISKFRYIKESGVSGGKRQLSITETRKLIKSYPYSYLEFEVLFCRGKVKS